MNDNKLIDAAKELLHLHLCEQEGLASGQPTRNQWLEAVDNLSKALEEYTGPTVEKSKEEIISEYFPNGAVNLKKIGGGDGKPQYKYEKQIMGAMLEAYASQFRASAEKKELSEQILQELGEKEVMMAAFAKIREMFEMRSWIMSGRGSYRYNDGRYQQEVRCLYDEFDEIEKNTWANIKTKTFEYRGKIIAQFRASAPEVGLRNDNNFNVFDDLEIDIISFEDNWCRDPRSEFEKWKGKYLEKVESITNKK